MIQVNTHEAKTKLSLLLSKVETEHEQVKICRNGKPIAILSPFMPKADPLKQHPELKGIKFNESHVVPLSEEEWPESYR